MNGEKVMKRYIKPNISVVETEPVSQIVETSLVNVYNKEGKSDVQFSKRHGMFDVEEDDCEY